MCNMKKPRLISNKRGTWIPRNDSSGVKGTLYPDYIIQTPKHQAAPNLTINGKLLLTSKKNSEPLIIRKPIKECYCYPELRKVQNKSRRMQHEPTFPCNHCKSHNDLQSTIITEEITPRDNLTSLPMSRETLRKVQSIIYSPRSRFLRDKLIQAKPIINQYEADSTSLDSELIAKTSLTKSKLNRGSTTSISKLTNQCSRINIKSPRSRRVSPKSASHVSYKPQYSKACECSRSVTSKHDNTQTAINQMSSKHSIRRKTVPSKKISNAACSFCRKFTCFGKCHLKYPKLITPRKINSPKINIKCKDCYLDDKDDNDIQDLYTFRSKNYFETHGSKHSFSSSESGSLEHYILNERLFPQPVGKVHVNDIVVTMPPCVTKQRKLIHYFPRYVVSQDRLKNFKGNSRKCHSCPLTGHAIDIGVHKEKYLPNSLALRYQKKIY